jgi:quercetin dioxygenase-like cupin family protein
VGQDDGWIFTALGGDDTGGILWHPSILRTAAEQGLYLTRDNMLVDTEAGATKPAAEKLIAPLDEATVQGLRRVSVEEMRRRVVKAGDRAWSTRALLDAVLPGHASELTPVIGHGMSEELDHAAKITNPHGFSMEWLRIPTGHRIGPFKLAEKQVLIVFAGTVEIALAGAEALRAEAREVFSAPPDLWRTLTAVGETTAEIAVITAGDQKKRVAWAPEIVRGAAQAGYGIDPAGYLAPLRLLPPSVQAHAA